MDFNLIVDYSKYQSNIEFLAKDRDMLMQLAFDLFDTNNDNRIS